MMHSSKLPDEVSQGSDQALDQGGEVLDNGCDQGLDFRDDRAKSRSGKKKRVVSLRGVICSEVEYSLDDRELSAEDGEIIVDDGTDGVEGVNDVLCVV